MTRALAIGALTSSAAAACGLRGGDFFETYVWLFCVAAVFINLIPALGSPPVWVAATFPSDHFHRLNLDTLVFFISVERDASSWVLCVFHRWTKQLCLSYEVYWFVQNLTTARYFLVRIGIALRAICPGCLRKIDIFCWAVARPFTARGQSELGRRACITLSRTYRCRFNGLSNAVHELR